MPDLYQVIERPLITEKALALNGENQYAFVVHPEANKVQIREAIEELFTTPEGERVTVKKVHTITVKGRTKRFRGAGRITMGKTPDYKKAIVTLAEGQTIQIFEGV
ncbi:MAG: 50S ribosomal protein L23 [Armatimonadaceae bacterium]